MYMNVEGVVLAAGLSSRMGVYKLTLNVMDKTIIESCIESMHQICSRIIVVGGYKFELISKLLSKYSNVKVIYNSNYADGMFSSVREGIKHINAEKFFLIPGDHPFVNPETYERMLEISSDIVVPRFEGRKGHPVLIKSCLINEILSNTTYGNLKEFINEHGFTAMDTTDPGILMDVDTLDDYNNIINNKVLICH